MINLSICKSLFNIAAETIPQRTKNTLLCFLSNLISILLRSYTSSKKSLIIRFVQDEYACTNTICKSSVAQFLTTSGVSDEIERIIMQAKYRLTLISPFFRVSNLLLEKLYYAGHREVDITIIYGKKDLNYLEEQKLKNIKSMFLYFCPNLHAKCYFNDDSMIISSMNLHQYSERNNREMGILIEKKDDYEMFIEATNEANSIKNSSRLVYTNRISGEYRRNGYCIRCSTNIQLNSGRPYCYSCYRKWAVQNNPQFKERRCHNCNREFASSLEQSVCQNCAPIFTA